MTEKKSLKNLIYKTRFFSIYNIYIYTYIYIYMYIYIYICIYIYIYIYIYYEERKN